MGTDIQIRGVPEETKRRIKERASADGLSMSEYLLGLIKHDLARPSRRDFAARLRQREPVDLGWSAGQALETVRREGS